MWLALSLTPRWAPLSCCAVAFGLCPDAVALAPVQGLPVLHSKRAKRWGLRGPSASPVPWAEPKNLCQTYILAATPSLAKIRARMLSNPQRSDSC